MDHGREPDGHGDDDPDPGPEGARGGRDRQALEEEPASDPEVARAHGPEHPDRGAAVRERPRLDRMDPQEREEPDEARETPGDHAHGVRRLLDRVREVVPRERPAPGPKEEGRPARGREWQGGNLP